MPVCGALGQYPLVGIARGAGGGYLCRVIRAAMTRSKDWDWNGGMKLSELRKGEQGVIVCVRGHGGFRKRIVEMGFLRGVAVEVVLDAPLKDPVKYRLLDYEVSLRRAEAELIEVDVLSASASGDGGEAYASAAPSPGGPLDEAPVGSGAVDGASRERVSDRNGGTEAFSVCFVGNPNCGKTSLFNMACGAHERVGNYAGVTVDAKVGRTVHGGCRLDLVDLPGTYSLTAYTPEELYVRKWIVEQAPGVIVNVVDASNLERNLYLTAQLIDMDVPVVMALNMYDELRQSGNVLDTVQLARLLGIPVVPTVGRKGEGVEQLLDEVVAICEDREPLCRHIHINHGPVLEKHIARLDALIRQNPEPHFNYSARFLAIKSLEGDAQIADVCARFGNAEAIREEAVRGREAVQRELGEDAESALTDAKYGFVQGALRECFVRKGAYVRQLTRVVDGVVTHPLLGYPVFLLLMYVMFFCTFNIGQYPMDWIDALVGWIGELIGSTLPDGPLKDLLVDGVIGGVGGVVVFLPNIMILYLFISWMEDSGYMARTAFIMDKIMHKMGLHGKSFIPMIMGFGCNIPAIMSTRTIEDRKSRLITMLIIPLMSCSARLPVYIIVIGAFFPRHSAEVMLLLYTVGIVMSVLLARVFSRFVVRGESSPFVMELPPYRLPSMKSVCRHTWEKGRQYLQKMGTTILAASVIVWALSYFPRPVSPDLDDEARMEQSYIGRLGKWMEPAIRPCGFAWKEGVSIVTGVGAKEIVASTMGVLYSTGDTDEQFADEDQEQARLSRAIARSHLTPLSAMAFLVFVLLYMPCIPACVAIRHESGHWRWAAFTIVYTTALAWLCATAVFQIGSLFFAA